MRKFKLTLSDSKMEQVVGHQLVKATFYAATKTKQRARYNIAAAGRIDKGDLYENFEIVESPSSTPMRPAFDVIAASAHAIFNEKGTKGAVAKPGGVMVFKPRGSQVLVFAKKVKGIRGIRFMEEALRSLTAEDFKVL